MNYIEVSKLLPSKYRHFIFLDNLKCTAGNLFTAHRLKVKVKETWDRENEEYHFVVCDVLKKDVPVFEKIMSKLKDTMYIVGNKDYEENCKRLFEELLGAE